MQCSWKKNWEETKQNFRKWWQQDGLVVAPSFLLSSPDFIPHDQCAKPPDKENIEEHFTDIAWKTAANHYKLANSSFILDRLPVANTNYGPGNLANFLGSESGFAEDTIWFHPTIHEEMEPEKLPPFKFDPENKWWKTIEAMLKLSVKKGKGKYLTGCPDIIENIDILASLRDAQVLLMDMLERPEWVEEKVMEINQVWFEVYDRIYDIIKEDDGSSVFWAFDVWGEGKTAKVQCDAAAMFSPDMFKRFVVPGLTEQCEWLDHSMFHLDGHQCICHLNHLLEIDALDAIEWTPDPTVPKGGDPCWYDMYKQILNAGKSVQIIGIRVDEIKPLLDTIGTNGVYLLAAGHSEKDTEKIIDIIDEYRK